MNKDIKHFLDSNSTDFNKAIKLYKNYSVNRNLLNRFVMKGNTDANFALIKRELKSLLNVDIKKVKAERKRLNDIKAKQAELRKEAASQLKENLEKANEETAQDFVTKEEFDEALDAMVEIVHKFEIIESKFSEIESVKTQFDSVQKEISEMKATLKKIIK